jgi:hypothetical protein
MMTFSTRSAYSDFLHGTVAQQFQGVFSATV